MNLRKHLLVGMTALSLGAGAFVVQAAEGGAGGDKPKAEARGDHFREHMEKRAKALHDKLKLTPEQEGAWTKLTDATMKPGTRPARPDRAKWEAMKTPERMDAMVDRMKDAEIRMTRRAAAVKEFYGVLTPEQQTVFDKEFAKMRGPMHGHE